jgi:hypothetical protein
MVDPPASSDDAMTSSLSDELSRSALQDNIEKKGKNAYYYAHSKTATGPKWDGKPQPKLLSRQSSSNIEFKKPTFEYSKSNIQKYAFMDGEKSVKLYIDLEGVGEKCADEDVLLEHSSTSMRLVVNNYKEEPLCLSFGKLTASIDSAVCKKKKDRLIVTLTKSEEGVWHTINDKGPADHEVV